MKKGNVLIIIIKIILALFPGTGLLIAASVFINNSIPLILPLVSSVCIITLFLLESSYTAIPSVVKKMIRILLFVYFTLNALFLLSSIIVIPFPVYRFWIQQLHMKMNGGTLSYLFILTLTFFSSLFCGLIFRHGAARPLIGLGISSAILLAVIYHNTTLIVITIVLLVLVIILLILSFKLKKNRPVSVISGLILLIASASISFLLSYNKPLYSGWMYELHLLPEIGYFIEKTFPVARFISSVGDYSDTGEGSALGFYPIDNRPVFRVRGKPYSSVYIRLEANADYTGKAWRNEKEYIPHDDSGRVIINSSLDSNPDIDIEILSDYCNLVPHTLDTDFLAIKSSVYSRSEGIPDAGSEVKKSSDLNNFDFNISMKLALPLILQDHVFLKLKTGNAYEQETKNMADDPEYFRRCLEVFSDLKKQLEPVAAAIKGNETDPASLLEKINSFLSENYYYSLQVKKPRNNKDFLLDFLFTQKKGFCQHFATASVIFARLCDIPARYVTGYIAHLSCQENTPQISSGDEAQSGSEDPLYPNTENRFKGDTKTGVAIVTGLQAHAWAEVWIPGSGWRNFETTPPLDPDSFSDPAYYARYNRDNDPLTRKQLSEFYKNRSMSPDQIEKQFFYRNIILTAAFFILGGTIAVFIICIGFRCYKKNKSLYKGIQRRIQTQARVMAAVAMKKKIPYPGEWGWKKWGEEAEKRFGLKSAHVARAINIILETFFSPRSSGKRELYYLKTFARRMKRRKTINLNA